MRTVAQELASVIMNEIMPRLKKHHLTMDQSPVTNEHLAGLVMLKCEGRITHRQLRQWLDIVFDKKPSLTELHRQLLDVMQGA